MKILDRMRLSYLAGWAIIAVFLAGVMASPYLLHAQSVGPGGVPGKNSGGAVSSVFGRTGAVVAATGDYTASQVTNAAATNAANTFTGTQSVSSGNSFTVNGDYPWALSSNASGNQLIINNNNGYADYAIDGGTLYGLSGYAVPSTGCYIWGTSSGVSIPAGSICSPAAGVLEVGSGSEANATGTIEAANLTLGGAPIEQAATAPTGSCSALEWVLSNDGHLSYWSGSGGTWTEKF